MTDITDFYNQIYIHRLRNNLAQVVTEDVARAVPRDTSTTFESSGTRWRI